MAAAAQLQALQARRLHTLRLGVSPRATPVYDFTEFVYLGLEPLRDPTVLNVPTLRKIRAARPRARPLIDIYINSAINNPNAAAAAAAALEESADADAAAGQQVTDGEAGLSAEALQALCELLDAHAESEPAVRMSELDNLLAELLEKQDLLRRKGELARQGGILARYGVSSAIITSAAGPQAAAAAAEQAAAEAAEVEERIAATAAELRGVLQQLAPVLTDMGRIVTDKLVWAITGKDSGRDGGGAAAADGEGGSDDGGAEDAEGAGGKADGKRKRSSCGDGTAAIGDGPSVGNGNGSAGNGNCNSAGGEDGGAVKVAYGGELRPTSAPVAVAADEVWVTKAATAAEAPAGPLPDAAAAAAPTADGDGSDGGGGDDDSGLAQGVGTSSPAAANGAAYGNGPGPKLNPDPGEGAAPDPGGGTQPEVPASGSGQAPPGVSCDGAGGCAQPAGGQCAQAMRQDQGPGQQHHNDQRQHSEHQQQAAQRRQGSQQDGALEEWSRRVEAEARAARLQCSLWWCMGAIVLRTFQDRDLRRDAEPWRRHFTLARLVRTGGAVSETLSEMHDRLERGQDAGAGAAQDAGTLHKLRWMAVSELRGFLRMMDISAYMRLVVVKIRFRPDFELPSAPTSTALALTSPGRRGRAAAAPAAAAAASSAAAAAALSRRTQSFWFVLAEIVAARALAEALSLKQAEAEHKAAKAAAADEAARRRATLEFKRRRKELRAQASAPYMHLALSSGVLVATALAATRAGNAFVTQSVSKAAKQATTDAAVQEASVEAEASAAYVGESLQLCREALQEAILATLCKREIGAERNAWMHEFADQAWAADHWGFTPVVCGSAAVLRQVEAEETAAGGAASAGGAAAAGGVSAAGGGEASGKGGQAGAAAAGKERNGAGGAAAASGTERRVVSLREMRLWHLVEYELADVRDALKGYRPLVCVGAVSMAFAVRQLMWPTDDQRLFQPTAVLAPGRRSHADVFAAATVAAVTVAEAAGIGAASVPTFHCREDPHAVPAGSDACVLLSVPGFLSHRDGCRLGFQVQDRALPDVAREMTARLGKAHGCIMMCNSVKDVETCLLAISLVRRERLAQGRADVVCLPKPMQGRDLKGVVRTSGGVIHLDDINETIMGRLAISVLEIASIDRETHAITLHPMLEGREDGNSD